MQKSQKKLVGGAQFVIYESESRHNGAFRRGMAELLQWIQEHGSITAATKLLWRSEGSLRRMLKETEETLGYQLVQNDAYRGSCLTPEGEVLLDIYTTLSVEVNQYANLRFKELMRQRFKDMAI